MDKNLAHRLDVLAQSRPDHPAVVDAKSTVTYSQFNQLVAGLSADLKANGINQGDAVAIAPPDDTAYLAIVYALARIGAIVTPIDPDLSDSEREELVCRFNVRALIVHGESMSIPGVTNINVTNEKIGCSKAPITDLPDNPDLPFKFAFSSGTTGIPKAFIVTHKQQQERIQAFGEMGLGSDERYLVVTSLHFDFGLRCAMVILNNGGTIILNQRLDSVERLVDVCTKHKITATYLMPAHLRQLIASNCNRAPLLPSVRFLLVGGSPLWAEDRTLAHDHVTPNLYEVYGANEVGLVALSTPQDQSTFPDSLGRSIDGAELDIVQSDGTLAPPGCIGQVRFRHPGITAGYLSNTKANSHSFRDGWFYPGDLAMRNQQGFIFFKGRADDVINVDGTKFYPAETEAILLQHPAVAEAAVVSAPWRQGRNVVVGYVVIHAPITSDELRAFCCERLSLYKVPHWLHILEDMPRTNTGKIAKRYLLDCAPIASYEFTGVRSPFETS